MKLIENDRSLIILSIGISIVSNPISLFWSPVPSSPSEKHACTQSDRSPRLFGVCRTAATYDQPQNMFRVHFRSIHGRRATLAIDFLSSRKISCFSIRMSEGHRLWGRTIFGPSGDWTCSATSSKWEFFRCGIWGGGANCSLASQTHPGLHYNWTCSESKSLQVQFDASNACYTDQVSFDWLCMLIATGWSTKLNL